MRSRWFWVQGHRVRLEVPAPAEATPGEVADVETWLETCVDVLIDARPGMYVEE